MCYFSSDVESKLTQFFLLWVRYYTNNYELPKQRGASNPRLEYEQQEDSSNDIKTAHRLMIGHQADGKHVLLSNQRDWITEGWCSGHCTQDFSLKPSDYELSVSYILGVKIFTRSLGTVAHIDVQYNNGSK